jgi:hypothetical protein
MENEKIEVQRFRVQRSRLYNREILSNFYSPGYSFRA